MNWQPIETAPKDGSSILLGASGSEEIVVGHWEADMNMGWVCSHTDYFDLHIKPTDWMPLPPPPVRI